MAKILIVEDSPTDRAQMEKVVRGLGHDPISADDGKTGMEKARQKMPDLILMDIVVPEINGFRATRMLTRDADTAHIPIVIVSTKDQDSDRSWGLRQGAREYLVKPIDPKQLKKAISDVLESAAA